MPTYDYKCADCGRIFEKFHGMNEQPQVLCPDCASVNTARQVSLGAGIVFKGSGFYVNDYKKGAAAESAKTNTAAATTTATSTETKETKEKPAAASTTESKPAASHACGAGCSHG
ncbi:MAG: zinc ribbon domain-containing protein [Spirochaetes bacterium]|nr:zinc ribbon domain-containing protein [Spirochaetota bacterium]